MKTWVKRGNMRLFAIVETRLSDERCGIVMTGESKHALEIAACRMVHRQKQARTRFEVVELAERATAHPLTQLNGERTS